MQDIRLEYHSDEENSHKFYEMHDNGSTFTARWGRVGAAWKEEQEYPMTLWDKKLSEKTKKGYEVVSLTNPLAKPKKQKSIDDARTQMKWVVKNLNRMLHESNGYDDIAHDGFVHRMHSIMDLLDAGLEISKDNLLEINNISKYLFQIEPKKMAAFKKKLSKFKKSR